jgi:hypothetical protein
MIQQKRREQLWKPITKDKLLPSLQRRIFLNLAQNDPQNINETARAVKGHYHSSHSAFKALVGKRLIKKVTSDKMYPCYWLTASGVFIALAEGVNPATLLERTLKIHPDNKDLQCLLEVSPILGTEAYNVALSAFLGKGKLEQTDKSTILATLLQKERSLDEAKHFFAILRKYPEPYRLFKEKREQVRENMRLLDSIQASPEANARPE